MREMGEGHLEKDLWILTVVLVSDVEQSASVIHIPMSILFPI